MIETKPCPFCQGLKKITIVELKRRCDCPVCGGSGTFQFVDQEESDE